MVLRGYFAILQNSLKGIVKFKLKPLPARDFNRLLFKFCISPGIASLSRNELAQAYLLNKKIQIYFSRTLKDETCNRLKTVYRLNCPPAGFHVEPQTRTCRNPRTCPWCYLRLWLSPAAKALLAVPDELRKDAIVLSWRYGQVATTKPPFFAADYGPHQWLSAHASVQVVVPVVNLAGNNFGVRHFGVHIVPASCNWQQALDRRALKQHLNGRNLIVTAQPAANVISVFRGLGNEAKINWLNKFKFSHRALILKAANFYPAKTRFLRINSYKLKPNDRN